MKIGARVVYSCCMSFGGIRICFLAWWIRVQYLSLCALILQWLPSISLAQARQVLAHVLPGTYPVMWLKLRPWSRTCRIRHWAAVFVQECTCAKYFHVHVLYIDFKLRCGSVDAFPWALLLYPFTPHACSPFNGSVCCLPFLAEISTVISWQGLFQRSLACSPTWHACE